MSSSMTPEVQWLHSSSSFTTGAGLCLGLRLSASSKLPQSAYVGQAISGLHWFASATTYQVARLPLTDLTRFPQPQETFTSRLSTIRSPSSSLDITTAATGQFPPVGLSPTRTAASFAAPDPSLRDYRTRFLKPDSSTRARNPKHA